MDIVSFTMGIICGFLILTIVFHLADKHDRRYKNYYLKKKVRIKDKYTLKDIQETLQRLEKFDDLKNEIKNMNIETIYLYIDGKRCSQRFQLDNNSLNIIINVLDEYYKEVKRSIDKYIEVK